MVVTAITKHHNQAVQYSIEGENAVLLAIRNAERVWGVRRQVRRANREGKLRARQLQPTLPGTTPKVCGRGSNMGGDVLEGG